MSRRTVAAARRHAPVAASCAGRIARYRKRFPRRDLSYRITAFEVLEARQLLTVEMQPLFELYSHDGATPFASPAPVGYTPAQIRHAYGFDQIVFNGGIVGDGAGQTIAIIDAYHSPTIQSDLHAFSVAFGLPDPPSFIQVAQDGSTNFPTVDPVGPGALQGNWELETALDVEWAHALAPKASILLVEANSPFFSDLVQGAVDYARRQPGVAAISMSFGSDEFPSELSFDSYFTTPSGHSNITFLASTGDHGRPGGYPAFSSNVVGVGGTSLTIDSAGNYVSESGWSGSGGSVSTFIAQPGYQQGVVTQSTTRRTSPDVSFVADPSTGVAVYDSYNWGTATPWIQVGGTSLSAPAWASIIAVADQGRALAGFGALDGFAQTLPQLYQLPNSAFHDITTGSNGFAASPGYDLVTGRGTPRLDLVLSGLTGNNVLTAHTDINLDAAKNLVITDLAGAADNLTIQSDTAHSRFVIHDPGRILNDSTGLGTALDLQTLAISFSAVTGTTIFVKTLPGADSLTLDYTLGTFSKQVDYDAGDPSTSPSDSLVLTGGASFLAATYTPDGPAGGSIDLTGNGTIHYHNVERVASQVTAADVSFNLPNVANAISLGDDGTPANSISRISGATLTTIDFSNPTASLTINRGTAADTLGVAALPDLKASLILGTVGKEFAAVSFAGAVALSANKNLSVTASGAISLTSTSSKLAASGAGTITMATSRNISLAAGSSLTTGAGDITLTSNQDVTATSGDFVGIEVNNATISSTSGRITLIGRGGTGNGGLQAGVFVHGGASVGGGTSATVTIAGTGGTSSGNENDGVLVADAGSMITSGGGNVNIVARGGGTAASTSNYGIYVRSAGQIKADETGTISVQGFGGTTTGDSNLGVFVTGAGSSITSLGGAIAVNGQGGGSGASANNYGVDIQAGGQIAASGSGTVVAQGTGGATTGGVDIGVFISDADSQITSGGGGVTVIGQGGGSGTSNNNHGISIQIGSQISAGGAGAVSASGTGGAGGAGVLIAQAGAQITSNSGTVLVTGQAGTANFGIQIGTIARITTNSAALTLVSDRIDVNTTSGVISAGSGTVSIRPLNANLAINLGGADGSTQLGLTAAELARVTAGTINFGDTQAYSGIVSISSAISVTPNLNFQWLSSANSTMIVNAAATSSGTFTTLNLDNATLNADISATAISGDAAHVTIDNNPSGQIQDGIGLAGPTGTVQVLSGNYNEDVDASAKSITFAPGIGTAQVNINGNLKLGSGNTLAVEIAGANATSQFDNLVVNGTVTLGGATLAASLVSFSPSASDSFIIISNNGSGAVGGTFNGLVESQILMAGETPLKISYQGGSGGNDVVLTPVTLVQVAASPASAAEDGSSNLVYTFTRLGPTTADLTVNFTVSGTATFATDYTQLGATTFTSTSGSVKISAGSATATVTIDPSTDTTVERDETIVLTTVAGTGYFVDAQAVATGSIVNDDTAVFTINDATVDEAAGTMQFTVLLSNPIDTVAKVNVIFTDITTSAGDFDHTAKQVVFAANSTTPQTITVPIVNDTQQENTETFTASLQLDSSTPLAGYLTVLTDTGTGTITDNDAPGSVNFNAPTPGSYRIVRNGANVDVFQGDNKLNSIPLSSTSITFNGTSGDDQLTIDYSGGDPAPSGGLIFNGGAQAHNTLGDVLRISGSGLSAIYTPHATVAGQGAIAISGHSISFTGLEPIDFDVIAGAITVSLPNAGSNVNVANSTLTDGTTPGLQISGTTGGTAFENVRVRNSAITIDTTAALGNDTVNIASADNAHGNTSLQVKAGSQSGDVINVNGVAKFSGAVTLDAATINLNADVMATVAGNTAATINVVAPAQIQDGVNLAATGATVNVAAGNYTEDVDASAKTLTLSPGPGAAQVRLTGNLKLGANNTLVLDLNGANPATQYDNFVVSGAATLGNSTLAVALGSSYTPAAGDLLKIVDAATLNGTFTNLAQGAAIAGGLLLDYHTATGDVNLLKNSPPLGVNDAASATEAGGVANGTVGIDPTGNVLLNDTDAENDPLAVTAVRAGAVAGSGAAGTLGAALVGQHGSLTLSAGGAFTYVINNNDPAVDALNATGTLTDGFNYTLSDGISSSTSVLTITIHGANDAPSAVADAISVAGKGGTVTLLVGGANSVLSNDLDVDTGDTKSVTQVNGSAAGVGTVAATIHGTVKLNADGTFVYTHDGSDNLTDSFTYEVSDTLGLKSTTSVNVTITNATNPDTTPNSVPDLAGASDSGASNTDNITSVKTPTFTGTTAAGLQVELVMDGSVVLGSTTSASPSGNWSIAASSMPDGAHLVVARVHETNGNISTSTALAVVIDSTPPAKPSIAGITTDTGISSTDGITSDKTLTLNGTAEADSVITIFDGATQLGTATANSAGVWTFSDIRTLADGPHPYTATATDVAGNTGLASIVFNAVVDTLPPTIAAPALLPASDSGSSNSDNITNVTLPTFTGAVESGATVTLFEGSTTLGTATAANGTYSITLTTPLADGPHNITAKASDAAGNTSGLSAPLVVTIDTTAPAIGPLVLSVASDSGASDHDRITNVTQPIFTGTADTGATVILLEGSTQLASGIATGGSWSIKSAALADGVHNVTAKAIDLAGNSTTTTAVSVTIDTAPPVISVPDLDPASDSGSSNTDNVTDVTTPIFNGTTEPGASVTLLEGTTVLGTTLADGSGNWSITSTALSAGSHSILAKAVDLAGNLGQSAGSLTVTIGSTLQVTSLMPTPSGFDVAFNRTPVVADLNLYDGFGATGGVLNSPDVTLHGATVGDVAGSLVWHADTNTLSFVKTGGTLANDTYTVIVFSGLNAVHDAAGHNLDGNGDLIDSQVNDNYVKNFTVNVAAGTRILTTADIARGPGQSVDEDPSTPGSSLAVSISDAAGVVSVSFDFHFDPLVLTVSGASLAHGLPSDWSMSFGKSADGDLTVLVTGATPLTGLNVPIAHIDATILKTAIYGTLDELSIDNLAVMTKGSAGVAPVDAIGDAAIHAVAYVGDADGNGIYTGIDSAEIARVVAHTDTGFHAFPNIDPRIIGNATATGTLNDTDAAYVAQKSVGLPRPEIPDLPQGPVSIFTSGGGSAALNQSQTAVVDVQSNPVTAVPILAMPGDVSAVAQESTSRPGSILRQLSTKTPESRFAIRFAGSSVVPNDGGAGSSAVHNSPIALDPGIGTHQQILDSYFETLQNAGDVPEIRQAPSSDSLVASPADFDAYFADLFSADDGDLLEVQAVAPV